MNSTEFILIVVVSVNAGVLLSGCKNERDAERVEYTKRDGSKTTDVKSIEDGAVSYEVRGGGPVPAEAKRLHDEARKKGEAGDYAAALTLLKRASELAPVWPYPRYDEAYTCLLQGDATNVLIHYREVDRLEPAGFFTTKTAIWTLEREERGILPKGTYLAFVSLEWMEPEKKKTMVEQLAVRLPTFAPVWKEKALLTENAEQRLAALEKAMTLEPDAETYGMCVLNKAAVLNATGKTNEAKQMLEQLARSESSTLTTKSLAKELLKKLSK